MRNDYSELNRNQHYVNASKEERMELMKFLKAIGFRVSNGFTEEDILNSPFPVTVHLDEKTIGRLGNATVSAAAASNDVILTPEEFYEIFAFQENGGNVKDEKLKEYWAISKQNLETKELVDAFVEAHNQWPIAEDEVYDYEEYSDEWKSAYAREQSWYALRKRFEKMVTQQAKDAGLYDEASVSSDPDVKLIPFMDQYGYEYGGGWWFCKEKKETKEKHMEFNRLNYYEDHDRGVLAKGSGLHYWIYDFVKREWVFDTKNRISDAIMGYDPSEPEGSPYGIGNTSIMDELKPIDYGTAMEIISDITVHMLLEDWKEKYRDAKAEWDKKPGWPAKLVNTSFCLYGTRYTIYPEDLGLGSEPFDEGFMMSIQKDLENDLLEAGASEISHSGEMD